MSSPGASSSGMGLAAEVSWSRVGVVVVDAIGVSVALLVATRRPANSWVAPSPTKTSAMMADSQMVRVIGWLAYSRSANPPPSGFRLGDVSGFNVSGLGPAFTYPLPFTCTYRGNDSYSSIRLRTICKILM
jgi:hypothetical protein